MDFSEPCLLHNKLLRSGSRRETRGLIPQMLSVPGGCLLANSPGGKGGASWVSGLSTVHRSTPSQASGPGSSLDRVPGNTPALEAHIPC